MLISLMQIQWSMRFEGEEVRAIALGSDWVAAITSLNFLRIYTVGGLQVCRFLVFNSNFHQGMYSSKNQFFM